MDTTLSLDQIIVLFQHERVTLAKAAELAGMHRLDFQRVLAERQIPVHYTSEDLAAETPLEVEQRHG